MPAKLGTRQNKIRYKETKNRLKIRQPDEGRAPTEQDDQENISISKVLARVQLKIIQGVKHKG